MQPSIRRTQTTTAAYVAMTGPFSSTSKQRLQNTRIIN